MEIRNRIKALEYIHTRDLVAHPGNWREHPKAQADALLGVLKEVGIAGALLAYRSERQGGALVVIDGHLRKDAAPQKWPVLVLDVNDEEADYLLATHDPLAAMATADAGALDALLSSVNSGEAAVQAMMSQLAARSGLYEFDPSEEWVGMPEFEHEDLTEGAAFVIRIFLKDENELEELGKILGKDLKGRKFAWFSKQPIGETYIVTDEAQP